MTKALCFICKEPIELSVYEEEYYRSCKHLLVPYVKVCDKCREAIINLRKTSEESSSTDFKYKA